MVSAELLLGIDLGTTSTKAAVVDLDGRELAHGRAPTRWRKVPTGAEADADDFVQAAIASAAQALAVAPPGRVTAVGVASMAETGALLDRDGSVVMPSIARARHRRLSSQTRSASAATSNITSGLRRLRMQPRANAS